jgi:hypothetical protein
VPPDLSVPLEGGIRTILEDFGAGIPESRGTPPGAIIDAAIVREGLRVIENFLAEISS